MSYKSDITQIKNDLEGIKAKLDKKNEYDFSTMPRPKFQRGYAEAFYNDPSDVKDSEMLNDINTMNEAEFLDKAENMDINDFFKYTEATTKWILEHKDQYEAESKLKK